MHPRHGEMVETSKTVIVVWSPELEAVIKRLRKLGPVWHGSICGFIAACGRAVRAWCTSLVIDRRLPARVFLLRRASRRFCRQKGDQNEADKRHEVEDVHAPPPPPAGGAVTSIDTVTTFDVVPKLSCTEY